MVFPLPLTVFERYMLADDRPWQPMAFMIVLRFRGELDEAAWRESLRVAQRREPLLSALVEGDSPGNLRWVAARDDTPWLDCQPHSAPLRFPDVARIDLQRERGLRCWVRHGDGRVEMRFQFHHSCCDGVGAYRFLDDLLRIYQRRLDPQSTVEPHALDPIRLKQRTQFGLRWFHYLLRLPLELIGVVFGSLWFFIRKSFPLESLPFESLAEDQLRELPDMPTITLSAEVVRSLATLAKSKGMLLNDLLTTDWLLAIQEWNEHVTGRPIRNTLRLMIPINLRGAADETVPAANIVGMTPIERNRGNLAHPNWLLRTVHLEMLWLKRARMAMSFHRVIGCCEKFYGSLKPFVPDDKCLATSTFSNMGRVFSDSTLPRVAGMLQSGGLLLEAVESAPPVRPQSRISITSLSYRGTLTVIANYERQGMSRASAQGLLERYAQRLEARVVAC